LTGVAVKVIKAPRHDGFAEAVIDTLTGSIGSTVIVMGFDVALFTGGQPLFELRMHVKTSPLPGV